MSQPGPLLALVAAVALASGWVVPAFAQEGAEVEVDPVSVADPAPAVTPRSSLPDDLPRQATSDLPRFAGPSTLRFSGERGAYAWHDVRFGADEVEARAVLTPVRRKCSARVRLVGDEGVQANEWFATGSGQKAIRESVMTVDYLEGKVRVDSDCERWSVRFTPLPDPELVLDLEESSYPVHGRTIDQLASQTRGIEDEWAAFTEWYTGWTYQTKETLDGEGLPSSCSVVDGQATVEAAVIYPEWKQPRNPDPDVVREWERFMGRLQVHELGHVTIALQGADAIDERLDAGVTAPTCEEARAKADEMAERIFERYAKASRRYDRVTDHGLAQGTGLR